MSRNDSLMPWNSAVVQRWVRKRKHLCLWWTPKRYNWAVTVSKWHVGKQRFTRYLASVWLILTCWDLFSVSYTMDDIILDWLSDKKGSLRVSHDLKIPQYTLVGWEQTSQVQEYSTGTLHYFKWCSMWWNTMNILREISSGFSDFWTPFLSWITLLPI